MDKRSITSMVVFLGNSPITWSAKKQCIVSCSSTEVEYHALASTTAELYWLRMLLRDFGIFLPQPPLLWCDNVSALAIASNPVFHARTKHIEVDCHFVHEKVLRCDSLVKFISTHDQLADLYNKGLPSPRFNWLTSKLMWKFHIRLRGDDNASSESNTEGEEATIPMASSQSKMVSCSKVIRYKTRLKCNGVVSH